MNGRWEEESKVAPKTFGGFAIRKCADRLFRLCVCFVCVCVCVSFNHSLGSHSILEILAKVLMDELVESSVRFVKEKYPAF